MDAHNLGLCLSPTLFALSSVSHSHYPLMRRGSLKRTHNITVQSNSPNLSSPANKELNDHMVSSCCLEELIQSHDQLFKVPADMMQLCRFTHLEFGDPVSFHELGIDKNGYGDYKNYIENCMITLAKVSVLYFVYRGVLYWEIQCYSLCTYIGT